MRSRTINTAATMIPMSAGKGRPSPSDLIRLASTMESREKIRKNRGSGWRRKGRKGKGKIRGKKREKKSSFESYK